MSLSQLNVLMGFLEAVKIISDNFIEVSINELYRESFIYRGVGGYIYVSGMSFEQSDHTISLLGEDDEEIVKLYVIYIDDEDEYEDEDDRPFFIRRMVINAYLIDSYEFDNTEEYEHDNRAAEAMNKYK